MSDINNKHLPADVDSLTRKDMVELYLMQIEEHQEMLKIIASWKERALMAEAEQHKRDIEQQIKALESTITENCRSIPFPYNCNTDVVYSDDIKYDIEQLRKELEK